MHLLWTDCEMTGLDINKDFMLEISVILTDKKLNKIYEKSSIFYVEKIFLDKMNEICFNIHKNSGLYDLCLNSKNKYKETEDEILEFLKKNTKEKNVFLAGNSVHYDLVFIKKFMPNLANWLHYRILDVSSLKLIYQMQNKKPFEKKNCHRTFDDILESIDEYKFYLENLIVN